MQGDTTPVTSLAKNIATTEMIAADPEPDANLTGEAVPGHDADEEVKMEEAEEERKQLTHIAEHRSWGGCLG